MPQPPGTGTAADGLTRHRLRFDSLAALGRSATGHPPGPWASRRRVEGHPDHMSRAAARRAPASAALRLPRCARSLSDREGSGPW